MRLALLAPVAATLAIAVCGSAAAGASRTAGALPCANKITKVQGKTAVGYCGPATASVTIGGKTYHFTSGLCIKTESFTIQLGTFLEGGKGNAGYPTLTINVTGAQGTLRGYFKGKQLIPDLDYLISAKGGGKNTGTFANGPNGPKLSGSWNCHGLIYKGTGG